MCFINRIRMSFFLWAILFLFLFVATASAYNFVSFSGEFDFLKKKFNILSDNSEKSSFDLKIQQLSVDEQTAFVKFNHLKTPFFDLSSDIVVKLRTVFSEETFEKVIIGKLSSQYSLFNYKPIEELTGEIEIRENQVVLKSISFGKISCKGTVSLDYPHKVDLDIELSDVEMESFLSFWTQKMEHDASGLVSGEIKVSGQLSEIYLQGRLGSIDGHVDNLKFNKFLLNIFGNYPEMTISESLVIPTEGMPFTFDGPFNIGPDSTFLKQVKALNISPLVKDSDSQVEWTLKSSSQKDMGQMELKYLLRKDIDSSIDSESSGMLGIENTIEF